VAAHSIRAAAGYVNSATADNSAALNAAITAAAADLTAGADTYVDQTGAVVQLTGNAQGLVTIPWSATETNILSFPDGAIVPKSNVRIEIDSGVEIRQYATAPGTGPIFQCDQGATTVTNFTICVGDRSRTAPSYRSGTTTGGMATAAERTGKWMLNLDASVYGCSPDVKGIRFGGLAHHCRAADCYAQSFCSETGGNALDGTSGMIINAPNPSRGNANNIVVSDCIGETPPSYGITEWNAGDNCLFLRLGCYGGVAVRWETQASTYSSTPVVPLSLSHNRAYDCWGKNGRRPVVITNHSTRFTVDDNIAYRTLSYSCGMLANCGNTPNDGGTPTITNCEINDAAVIAGTTALNTTGAATWLRGNSTDVYSTNHGAQPVMTNVRYDNSAGVAGFSTTGASAGLRTGLGAVRATPALS
jgi:hypothetical protein